MSNRNMVREFREAFYLHVGREPGLPSQDDLRLHHKLIQEETDELKQAVINRDAHEVLDALADITYLAYGAALDCGYDLDEALARVHAANMGKLRGGKPLYRADGKVIKPDGWRAADLSDLVKGDGHENH